MKTSRIGSHVVSVDMRGATVRLSREEWGFVIDALIEHTGSSRKRKRRNSESSSDLRAEVCTGLIRMIGSSLSGVGAHTDTTTEKET